MNYEVINLIRKYLNFESVFCLQTVLIPLATFVYSIELYITSLQQRRKKQTACFDFSFFKALFAKRSSITSIDNE